MNKEWFFFPKGDRRAILILSLVITGLLLFLWWKADDGGGEQAFVTSSDSSAVISFRDSILQSKGRIESSVRRDTSFKNRRSYKQRQGDWVSDFSRPTGKKVFLDRVKKFSTDTVLDLNTVDTLLLKRVPGIGSWRARRIVEFRGHLGGYSKVSQLMEIDGMPDSLLCWFAIKTPSRKLLNLNRATADEMAAHPYLTYKQARVILRHKRLHGPLQSLDQLSLYEEFTKEQLERLEPYVAF